jgi:hypothetical protein
MKTTKISALALLFTFSILLSCNKSEENAVSIAGTWKLIQSEDYDCDVATDNGVDVCGTFSWCTTVTFKADGTFEVFRTSDNVKLGSGTYALASGMLITTYTGTSGTTHKITVNGNTMVINTVSETATCSSNDTFQKM